MEQANFWLPNSKASLADIYNKNIYLHIYFVCFLYYPVSVIINTIGCGNRDLAG